MLFTNLVDNSIYVFFNDLEKDLISQISKELKGLSLDRKVINKIIEFIKNNELDDNLKRQKRYISNISTYVDMIDASTQYNLFLYILPKEISISHYKDLDKSIIFSKIEKISIDVFKLYTKYINKKDLEFKKLKEYKGDSFLELELEFYINELNNLYNHLLNYKKSLIDKIICSDKQVGISIEYLNMMNKNPLNNYQFVKVAHQEDLIIFIYSLMEFLKDKRLNIFSGFNKYKDIVKIADKIYNFLKKMSSKRIKQDSIKDLTKYFIRYKNKKEIQKNKLLFQILEKIFYNQLHNGVFLFKSVDLTKMFEGVVNMRLAHYEDNLYIGDETAHKIKGKQDLNDINYLLKPKRIKQYPDFLIKQGDIFHIVDAKYKLYDSLFRSRDIFWQILIYAKLFNKSLDGLENVEKVIIYPNKFSIDISREFNLKIDKNQICIFKNGKTMDENVFDTNIRLIGVDILLSIYDQQ